MSRMVLMFREHAREKARKETREREWSPGYMGGLRKILYLTIIPLQHSQIHIHTECETRMNAILVM